MALKLNRYIAGVEVINNNLEKIIFNSVFWSFAVLVFVYVVLLGNMVWNIVERQSLETYARSLTSEVRNLEVTYLSMSNNIDLDYSYSLGFKDTPATFATRKSLGLNIVQNDL